MYPFLRRRKDAGKGRIRKYKVTEDVDIIAPSWLAIRINEGTVLIIRKIQDGAETLKGVKINDQTARVGDTICFNGKQLSVERR